MRLQESSQTEGTVVDPDNGDEPSSDVSVKLRFITFICSSYPSSKDLQTDGSEGNEDNDVPSDTSGLSQNEHRWQGSCFHNFDVPRWVQKSRHVESDGSSNGAPAYIEPRRAVEVAVNARFSLVAVGTYR